MGWIDDVADMDATDLAGRLGLHTCPLCGHETDSRRGRLGSLRFKGPLWTCHGCNQGGNTVSMLCAVVLGRKRAQGSAGWRRVQSAAHALGVGGSLEVVKPRAVALPYLREAQDSMARELASIAFETVFGLDTWSNHYRRALACVRDGLRAEEVERRRQRLAARSRR